LAQNKKSVYDEIDELDAAIAGTKIKNVGIKDNLQQLQDIGLFLGTDPKIYRDKASEINKQLFEQAKDLTEEQFVKLSKEQKLLQMTADRLEKTSPKSLKTISTNNFESQKVDKIPTSISSAQTKLEPVSGARRLTPLEMSEQRKIQNERALRSLSRGKPTGGEGIKLTPEQMLEQRRLKNQEILQSSKKPNSNSVRLNDDELTSRALDMRLEDYQKMKTEKDASFWEEKAKENLEQFKKNFDSQFDDYVKDAAGKKKYEELGRKMKAGEITRQEAGKKFREYMRFRGFTDEPYLERSKEDITNELKNLINKNDYVDGRNLGKLQKSKISQSEFDAGKAYDYSTPEAKEKRDEIEKFFKNFIGRKPAEVKKLK
jgi:hypothetical protein